MKIKNFQDTENLRFSRESIGEALRYGRKATPSTRYWRAPQSERKRAFASQASRIEDKIRPKIYLERSQIEEEFNFKTCPITYILIYLRILKLIK